MKNKFQTFESLIVFGLYLIPILLWSTFSFSHMKASSHWTLFALGLLIATLGTLAIRLLTPDKLKEENLVSPIPQMPIVVVTPPKLEEEFMAPPLFDPQPLLTPLQEEIEQLKNQIISLKEDQKQDKNLVLLKHEEHVLALETTLGALKKDLSAKDEIIAELKLKIAEQEYEIRALVDFNEEESNFELAEVSENDAGRILKKWVEAASALSPGSDSGNLGRLIQGEPGALVFVYSFKENKALYANGHSLTLFGLTPEQFASQFHNFLPLESLEWHEALTKMNEEKWAAIPLNGANAVMAPVNRGPLQGHCLGIVY